MTQKSEEIERKMMSLANPEEAFHLMRFFKCRPGEYGYGDRFLGIRVPQTRTIVSHYKKDVELPDAACLTFSPWHEIRLAGFLLLIELFKSALRRKDYSRTETILKKYLELIPQGNNWDLVDLVAPKILGQWLLLHPEQSDVLRRLSPRNDSLWHQRVAIVACWTLIRDGRFAETIAIAEHYLDHKHDLIHKATGWMLREIGKRGGTMELLAFLDRHAHRMPRTMLRYSIEKLPQELRRHYLTLPRT